MKRAIDDNEFFTNFRDLPREIQAEILSLYPETLRRTPFLTKGYVEQFKEKLCDLEIAKTELISYLRDNNVSVFGTHTISDERHEPVKANIYIYGPQAKLAGPRELNEGFEWYRISYKYTVYHLPRRYPSTRIYLQDFARTGLCYFDNMIRDMNRLPIVTKRHPQYSPYDYLTTFNILRRRIGCDLQQIKQKLLQDFLKKERYFQEKVKISHAIGYLEWYFELIINSYIFEERSLMIIREEIRFFLAEQPDLSDPVISDISKKVEILRHRVYDFLIALPNIPNIDTRSYLSSYLP